MKLDILIWTISTLVWNLSKSALMQNYYARENIMQYMKNRYRSPQSFPINLLKPYLRAKNVSNAKDARTLEKNEGDKRIIRLLGRRKFRIKNGKIEILTSKNYLEEGKKIGVIGNTYVKKVKDFDLKPLSTKEKKGEKEESMEMEDAPLEMDSYEEKIKAPSESEQKRQHKLKTLILKSLKKKLRRAKKLQQMEERRDKELEDEKKKTPFNNNKEEKKGGRAKEADAKKKEVNPVIFRRPKSKLGSYNYKRLKYGFSLN